MKICVCAIIMCLRIYTRSKSRATKPTKRSSAKCHVGSSEVFNICKKEPDPKQTVCHNNNSNDSENPKLSNVHHCPLQALLSLFLLFYYVD